MDNKEIIINNNEVYKTIKEIVFVRDNEKKIMIQNNLFLPGFMKIIRITTRYYG